MRLVLPTPWIGSLEKETSMNDTSCYIVYCNKCIAYCYCLLSLIALRSEWSNCYVAFLADPWYITSTERPPRMGDANVIGALIENMYREYQSYIEISDSIGMRLLLGGMYSVK